MEGGDEADRVEEHERPLLEEEEPELPASDIHDVLRNDRRRRVLELLGEADGEVTARELSEAIATMETGSDPPPRNVRQSVYISLQQTHLPKLDDLDIVEYDADAKTVAAAENAADVGVYMEVVPKYGLAWSEYYGALGVLGALLVVASAVGVPVIRQLGPSGWALGLFAVIAASGVYQTHVQRSSLVKRLRD